MPTFICADTIQGSMTNEHGNILQEHDEGIRYIIFGVLTVIVSWVTYAGFVFLGIDLWLSNILSWICAVVFAFVVNKIYVFRCFGSSFMKLGAEIVSFFGGRIFTGVVAALLFPALCAVPQVGPRDSLRLHPAPSSHYPL